MYWKQPVIFFSAVLFVIMVGSLVTSVWLLVGLLPAETQWRYALEEPAALARMIKEHLPLEMGDVSALAMAQMAEGRVLVIKPRLLAWRRTARALQEAGWQVERVGWLLRASQREETRLPTFGSAMVTVVRQTLGNNLAMRPAIWAQGEFGQAVGVWHGSRLRVAGVFGQQPLPSRLVYSPPIPAFNADVWVAGRGEFINLVPLALQQELNQQLADGLGFSKTTPAWLPAAGDHHFLAGRVGEGVFIGQRGAAQEFREQVITWMQEEDSRLHPQRQLFSLPDGTRGYESIPGKSRAVLASSTDEDGCAEPLIETPALWLCMRDDTAIASTLKEVALAGWQQGGGEYQIHLAQQFSQWLPVADINRVSIIGGNDYAVMDVIFAKNRRWP